MIDGSLESMTRPMVIVIESGSIYSLCLLVLIILYASHNFAQYIVLDALNQIIVSGIKFIVLISNRTTQLHTHSRGSSSLLSLFVSALGSQLKGIKDMHPTHSSPRPAPETSTPSDHPAHEVLRTSLLIRLPKLRIGSNPQGRRNFQCNLSRSKSPPSRVFPPIA
jgi:hypothetical protein